MLQFYNALLLTLFVICSATFHERQYHKNRTNVPSRTIYDLVQARRAAAILAASLNRSRHNITFEKFKKPTTRIFINDDIAEDRLRGELGDLHASVTEHPHLPREAVFIIIGVILFFTLITVIACLVIRYFCFKEDSTTYDIEHERPLNPPKQIQPVHRISTKTHPTSFVLNRPKTGSISV